MSRKPSPGPSVRVQDWHLLERPGKGPSEPRKKKSSRRQSTVALDFVVDRMNALAWEGSWKATRIVRFGSLADIAEFIGDFRFVPKAEVSRHHSLVRFSCHKCERLCLLEPARSVSSEDLAARHGEFLHRSALREVQIGQ